jgi:hypothetical protein
MSLYKYDGTVKDFTSGEFKRYLIEKGQVMNRNDLPKRCKERASRDFWTKRKFIYAVLD